MTSPLKNPSISPSDQRKSLQMPENVETCIQAMQSLEIDDLVTRVAYRIDAVQLKRLELVVKQNFYDLNDETVKRCDGWNRLGSDNENQSLLTCQENTKRVRPPFFYVHISNTNTPQTSASARSVHFYANCAAVLCNGERRRDFFREDEDSKPNYSANRSELPEIVRLARHG